MYTLIRRSCSFFYFLLCALFFGSIHIVALLSSPLFMLDLFQIQFPAGVKRYLTQSHSPSAFSQQKEVDEETLELWKDSKHLYNNHRMFVGVCDLCEENTVAGLHSGHLSVWRTRESFCKWLTEHCSKLWKNCFVVSTLLQTCPVDL